MHRSAIALILALIPSSGSASFFYTGNQMHELCQASPLSAHIYAAGVLDGASAIEYWETDRVSVCPSEGVTVTQAGDVMCRRLEENPQERHLSSGAIAWNSFHAAWPCPN